MAKLVVVSKISVGLALAAGAMAQEAPLPKSRLELGLEARVRSEEYDNIIDHNASNPSDAKNFYRFRTRAWLTARPSEKLEFSVGLCNENRKMVRPDVAINARELVFDTFYVDYRFSPAWSVRLGRQNLQRGEGFVLFDGSSADGSRTAYFNALDLTRTWGRSTLEFLAISDPSKDQYLPRINEAKHPEVPQALNEWNEQALGLYYTNREWEGTRLEAYYFFKTETEDARPVSHPQFQPDRRIQTLGARGVRDLSGGWSASAECAGQWGRQDARPGTAEAARTIAAWGGTARVKRAIDAPWKPVLSLGYIALSGQDPTSSRITAWDPLFSRWPRWSELYVYSQVPEKGVAYATNLGMCEAELRLRPSEPLELRATWYRMRALESAPTGAVFGKGKDRGDLLELRADYRFSPAFKGHVLYEHLAPGSFYAGQSAGHFLRFELSWLFTARF
jgi:hypothetical protein